MTELSFLIDLFLIPDIPCNVRDMLVDRIKEVEEALTMTHAVLPKSTMPITVAPMTHFQPNQISNFPPQAPSTIRLMAHHGTLPAGTPPYVDVPVTPPEPVAVIAQTQATAAAMASREAAIQASIAGKVDKVSGKPRKF